MALSSQHTKQHIIAQTLSQMTLSITTFSTLRNISSLSTLSNILSLSIIFILNSFPVLLLVVMLSVVILNVVPLAESTLVGEQLLRLHTLWVCSWPYAEIVDEPESGAWHLTGGNLEAVRAEFSTLS